MSTSHWAQIKLGEATTKVGSGATPTGGKDSYHSSGIPFVRSQNVRFEGFSDEGLVYIDDGQAANLTNATVKEGDVLLNITGASIGRVTVAPSRMNGARVNQHVAIIRPVDGLNPSFLRWFLASPSHQQLISTIQSGVTRQALTRDMILNFAIPPPPYAEQVRIIAKIETLFSDVDAGVVAVKRATADLLRYRAAVLKDAMDGSLTADWRATHSVNEPGSKLLQRILAERRRLWEADQLARFATDRRTPPKNWQDGYIPPLPPDIDEPHPLPTSWCWVTVEQLGEVQLGRQRSPKNRSKEHPTQYIRAANLTEQGLDVSDVLEMNFSPAERDVYRLSKGDILLSEASGSPDQVGKPAVWNDELPECCFQNTVIRLRPTLPMSAYLLVVFRHCYFNNVFAAHVTGVGINHLSAAGVTH